MVQVFLALEKLSHLCLEYYYIKNVWYPAYIMFAIIYKTSRSQEDC